MATFSDMLVYLRKREGLSQKDLADKTGLTRSAIGMYETGKREPDFETLEVFADFFNVNMDTLLGKSEVPSSSPANMLPPGAFPFDPAKGHRIPILGRISAGLPLYAEEHVEGYTLTDLNGCAEYFGLRVQGDSMNALRINEGDIIIVRRQEEVEQGEVAVVLVDGNDATVKRFYSSDTTVTLMPQSTNPEHKPQMYDLSRTSVRVLGKVVEVKFSL